MLEVEVIGVDSRLRMGSDEEKRRFKDHLQVLRLRNEVDEKKGKEESMGGHTIAIFCFSLERFI